MELFNEHLGKNNQPVSLSLDSGSAFQYGRRWLSPGPLLRPGPSSALGALCPCRPRPTDTLLRARRGRGVQMGTTAACTRLSPWAGGQRKLKPVFASSPVRSPFRLSSCQCSLRDRARPHDPGGHITAPIIHSFIHSSVGSPGTFPGLHCSRHGDYSTVHTAPFRKLALCPGPWDRPLYPPLELCKGGPSSTPPRTGYPRMSCLLSTRSTLQD